MATGSIGQGVSSWTFADDRARTTWQRNMKQRSVPLHSSFRSLRLACQPNSLRGRKVRKSSGFQNQSSKRKPVVCAAYSRSSKDFQSKKECDSPLIAELIPIGHRSCQFQSKSSISHYNRTGISLISFVEGLVAGWLALPLSSMQMLVVPSVV